MRTSAYVLIVGCLVSAVAAERASHDTQSQHTQLTQPGSEHGAAWHPQAGSSRRRAVLEVTRQQAATPKKKATTKPLTPSSYGLKGGQTSCKVLTPGKLLIHWRLDAAPARAKVVYGALQAVIPKGYDSKGIWMGFGMSDPANEGAYMYQSDVVVAGFKGTTCFAKDFYLSAYSTCGQPKGQPAYGACSDSTHARNSTANNVALTACSIRNGVVTVEWRRPIKASDKWDRSWPTGAGQYFVHAIGPLSPKSPASQPVLNQHFDITPTPPNFKFSLGTTAARCSAVLKR